MWTKWLPWRFVVRSVARAQGFLDPVSLLSHLQRFSQPSEVIVPTELLRAGAVLQARGLMNSQAIQHNLDWIWPYWVERQFDPKGDAFVPRAFNITHINLTNRNWTAIGVPDSSEMPIVDPRGLVTPLYDGWSIDVWIIPASGEPLLPSRLACADQKLLMDEGLSVETRVSADNASLISKAEVVHGGEWPVCRLSLEARSAHAGWLVVSLRPYNPEGVSFIHDVETLPDRPGWKVNNRNFVYFSQPPQHYGFSRYQTGDVYGILSRLAGERSVRCDVGMATAAALFAMTPGEDKMLTVEIPLGKKLAAERKGKETVPAPPATWAASLETHSRLEVPDAHFQFLYDAAVRSLILHSPGDVYPGPYTYKRFWFRDAAFILHAMLCVNLADRVERVLERFASRQTPFGYFLSQEGEWDSNGEALWTLRRFCELTGRAPEASWKSMVLRAGKWIERKRVSKKIDKPHAGLLPAGFSAEHLGPNDFYYWDDFWGIAGLGAAAFLMEGLGDKDAAREFRENAADFSRCLEASLEKTINFPASSAIPASPYRRLDAGSIGSLAGGYPLKLWAADDKRLSGTAEFLMDRFFVDGGFFQEISHSGINPYLTLHVAQVLLRAGDDRYFDLMKCIAALASPTGQWPEAVHPRTKGGCMGDGQHIWAAAEWALMQRNAFVREEESAGLLILGSGIPAEWIGKGPLSLSDAPTSFGKVSVKIESEGADCRVSWKTQWFSREPVIEIRVPGFAAKKAAPGSTSVLMEKKK